MRISVFLPKHNSEGRQELKRTTSSCCGSPFTNSIVQPSGRSCSAIRLVKGPLNVLKGDGLLRRSIVWSGGSLQQGSPERFKHVHRQLRSFVKHPPFTRDNHCCGLQPISLVKSLEDPVQSLPSLPLSLWQLET